MSAMCGGVGSAQDMTPEVKEICESVRPKLESKLGKTVAEFTPISFKSQVVAGVNYFVKVHIGNNEYVHLRIYKPLPHTGEPASLHSHQLEKTLESEIEYF